MKKYFVLFCLALVCKFGFTKQNNNPNYQYNDIKIFAKDFIDAVLDRDSTRLKHIQNALLMPYSKFKSTLLPSRLYPEFSGDYNDSNLPEFINPKSLIAKNINTYKKLAGDYYSRALINQWINDTDYNYLNKNIYISYFSSDKIKDKDSTVYQLDIILETKNFIKVFSFSSLIVYNNILYTYQSAEYQSNDKNKISDDDFVTDELLNTYKLVNDKFEKFSGKYLQFKNIKNSSRYSENEITDIKTDLNQTEKSTVISEEPETFERAEVMPKYPGGVAEMMKYINKNLIYPKLAKENNLEGKVLVKFYIDIDGSIKGAQVLKDGVGGGATEEAIRLVNNMPKWTPGTQRGKPVKVYYILPIPFKLQ